MVIGFRMTGGRFNFLEVADMKIWKIRGFASKVESI